MAYLFEPHQIFWKKGPLVPWLIVLFGKRYEDDLKLIFDLWPNLHLGLDALSNQKNLERYLILTWYNHLVPCKFSWLCSLFVLTKLFIRAGTSAFFRKKALLINAIQFLDTWNRNIHIITNDPFSNIIYTKIINTQMCLQNSQRKWKHF